MLGPKPQPDMAGRTEFTKAIKYSAQCVNDGFVWMEHYFAIGFAPYWPDGQTPAQLPRAALLRIPPSRRARRMCSSASLIVPFRPSSSRSLNDAGLYTPS